MAIVGAGFGGIAAAVRARQAGVKDLVILEREPRVGGVWEANSYPGLACDVPSNLYSLSFAPNPHWSRRFAPREEIRAYLERVAHDFGLEPHLRLGTEVTTASWDDEAGHWRLELAGGENVEAEVLVTACGQVARPRIPAPRRAGRSGRDRGPTARSERPARRTPPARERQERVAARPGRRPSPAPRLRRSHRWPAPGASARPPRPSWPWSLRSRAAGAAPARSHAQPSPGRRGSLPGARNAGSSGGWEQRRASRDWTARRRPARDSCWPPRPRRPSVRARGSRGPS
ncbi:MAG: NAD(P)-binding protein, partial [Solirubrobacterales bacterium]